MQDGLDHAQGLVISLAAASDLIHTQGLKEAVDGQQQGVQVNGLHSTVQCTARCSAQHGVKYSQYIAIAAEGPRLGQPTEVFHRNQPASQQHKERSQEHT
jgi:hypothetical protein